jgi:hypothetical protein
MHEYSKLALPLSDDALPTVPPLPSIFQSPTATSSCNHETPCCTTKKERTLKKVQEQIESLTNSLDREKCTRCHDSKCSFCFAVCPCGTCRSRALQQQDAVVKVQIAWCQTVKAYANCTVKKKKKTIYLELKNCFWKECKKSYKFKYKIGEGYIL